MGSGRESQESLDFDKAANKMKKSYTEKDNLILERDEDEEEDNEDEEAE